MPFKKMIMAGSLAIALSVSGTASFSQDIEIDVDALASSCTSGDACIAAVQALMATMVGLDPVAVAQAVASALGQVASRAAVNPNIDIASLASISTAVAGALSSVSASLASVSTPAAVAAVASINAAASVAQTTASATSVETMRASLASVGTAASAVGGQATTTQPEVDVPAATPEVNDVGDVAGSGS